ncbi:hypothetical protein [Actinokineospora sp.]|uniref:hypothetical protein n=1 Tax=Actinokineospora sp. TaxID=1872133 RepID=UPI004037611B
MTVLSERGWTAPGGLVRDVRRAGATWAGTLAVARQDPYFFDHPLDHLPGMALVCGLLDLVRGADLGRPERPGARMTLSLEFPSFCELGAPVALEAVRRNESGATLRASQAGQPVCEGTVDFRPTATRPARGAPPTTPRRADATQVNRRRQENVLIAQPVIGAEVSSVEIRRPAPGHRLATAPGAPPRAETLLDAARQFGTLVCHLEFGRAPDTTLVLLGVDLDVVCGLTGGIRLTRARTEVPRSRHRSGFDILADGEPAGRVDFDYFAAKPAVYRRMRGEVRVA